MGITHGWTSGDTPDGSDVTPTNMNSHTIESGTVTEAMLSIADNTTKNVSTSAHGFVPKAPNDTTKFLRGDGTWAAPPAKLWVDTIALDAAGDDFGDTALPGWTKVGSGSATAVTDQLYDPSCIKLQFAASGDRLYKAIDSGDWTYYLAIHGITNDSADAGTALGAMLGLAATNDSGAGTGVSAYNDSNAYLWVLSGNVYSSTGPDIASGWSSIVPAAVGGWPLVYKLAKSGTTITGGLSFNGGLTWKQNSRTDATTFTRINIVRMYSGGGTNPALILGRFNLVP